MTKTTDFAVLLGADVVAANDFLPIIDDSETGTVRNKRITVAQLKAAVAGGALAAKDTVNNSDWSGTALAIANGGTGASTPAAARTNLDVYSKAEVDAAVAGGGGSGLTAAADTEVWTGTSTSKGITPKALFDAAKFQTLTDGATITPDFGAGLNFKVTLGGNRTLANPINAKDGQSGVIRVIQDGTGSRTLAYGSNWRFPGGTSTAVLSTTANAIDIIAYTVGEGGLIYAVLNKAFAA